MNNKYLAFLFASLFLHLTFIMLSYSSTFLSGLGNFVDPIIAVRTFMLLQFLPLIIVVNNMKLSKRKSLLFLTFAICLSTLYIVDDFNTGFYGVIIDNETGIMPRMRASAHLMAYKETGRLVMLDFHAEYFLEYILIHFLSEITGLNYIITYFFIARVLLIIIWSLVFVWSSTLAGSSKHRLVTLLLACSIMLANQGYNYEVSFAPILLFLFLIIARKLYNRNFIPVFLLIMLSILFASFRETLLLGIVSFVMLCILPWNKNREVVYSGLPYSRFSFNATILILVCSRVFLFASYEYFYGYVTRFLRLFDSLVTVLRGNWKLEEAPLATLARIQNPLDMNIAYISVVSAVSILVLIALLSVYFVLKKNKDSLFYGVSIAYLLAFSIAISGYIINKITVSESLIDFSAVTVLPRTLLPPTTLLLALYLKKIKIARVPLRKVFLIVITLYLSIITIFAPFIFLRREVKSSYDMLRVSGDNSEYTLLGNKMYKFVMRHISRTLKIRILSPTTSFLQHYYLLPLQYKTQKQIETGYINLTIESKIYDNRIFTVSTYDSSAFFLNEAKQNNP